jgi:hypothetical protein
MRITRFLVSALLLACVPSAAMARMYADNMTCEAVIAEFEARGSIVKLVAGKPLRVSVGLPIRKAQGLTCGPNNYSRQTMSARTVDNRRCIYAVYCHGFDNEKKLRPR